MYYTNKFHPMSFLGVFCGVLSKLEMRCLFFSMKVCGGGIAIPSGPGRGLGRILLGVGAGSGTSPL